MTIMNKMVFHPIQDEDIPLMKEWLGREHVSKWYGSPEDWLEEMARRNSDFSFVKHFIVRLEGQPIGFCQYYTCIEAQEDWYGHVPLAGSYSLDYMIGEERFLGQGLGKAIVAWLIRQVFSLDESQRIIVAPEPENSASCRSLLANRFVFDERNNLYLLSK